MVEQDDRRRAQRHRTLKAGLIAFNRAGTIDCRVRNLSAVGACLEVAGQVGIPDQFTLLVEHDGFKQQCRVVWRTPNRLGVEFIGDRFHHDLKTPQNAVA
jgi:hypothetical protein